VAGRPRHGKCLGRPFACLFRYARACRSNYFLMKRGWRARSRWNRGVLAAGISMAATGLIATPLGSNADTLAAGGEPMSSAASLRPAMDARGVPLSGTRSARRPGWAR